jgi:hypothetical protein
MPLQRFIGLIAACIIRPCGEPGNYNALAVAISAGTIYGRGIPASLPIAAFSIFFQCYAYITGKVCASTRSAPHLQAGGWGGGG